MIPIGPAPVIRTSSPSTGKESAVWTAFPKGSKIAAISRLIFESWRDRKSTRLNPSHLVMSYAVFCLKKKSRSASLQLTFKKSFTSFSYSTRTQPTDGLITVRIIRALNDRFNTSLTHAYSIVIGSKHITLNATGGGFLTASKQFRHGATSKSRSNTASNSTKHKSPHLSGWRQIISLIT